jgi:hypothetical protein
MADGDVDRFRFIAIDQYADMTSYGSHSGREKLDREARLSRQRYERMIADRAARGQVFAPSYIIDYAENESFWRDYFAQLAPPSPSDLTNREQARLSPRPAIAHSPKVSREAKPLNERPNETTSEL